MGVRIKVDEGAFAPSRAHDTDAGLDIRARRGKIVRAHGSAVFKTGVHIQLEPGTCGILVSKSGLNVNNDITSTGLIDEGYSGEIIVKLYNFGKSNYVVRKGDKISQLVIIPVLYDYEIVDSIEGGERGENGFGSSGK